MSNQLLFSRQCWTCLTLKKPLRVKVTCMAAHLLQAGGQRSPLARHLSKPLRLLRALLRQARLQPAHRRSQGRGLCLGGCGGCVGGGA